MYYLQPSSQLIAQIMQKINRVDQKQDKDGIFTLKKNPRRVYETIYSFKFDSLSNPNIILRLINDPTNSPNAALRLIHDLRQTARNALEIDT